MDFGDADSEKWLEYAGGAPFPLSAGFRLEGRKVRRYERWLGSMFDACSVNAPREREILGTYVTTPIHVIPNGVDLDYFRRVRAPCQALAPRRLFFTRIISYKPYLTAIPCHGRVGPAPVYRSIPD